VASFRGHVQIVQQLLEKKADANAHGELFGNALQAASFKSHDQIVQQLLEKGAAQGGICGNALQATSFNGHVQVVLQLLGKGANVNAQGRYYSSALQGASTNGHDQVVQHPRKREPTPTLREDATAMRGRQPWSAATTRSPERPPILSNPANHPLNPCTTGTNALTTLLPLRSSDA
jgi:ankyrin repeat protein